MAWYRTGTVAVTLNSATVTGTGTSFSANARVGDGFLGPDGRWYEVTNIASATVISITPNYQGSTASGQTYAIAPLQGYNLESATKMRTIIDSWGTTLSVLGAASTTAQLRTNIGAAASGLNADITRLNGLTTAITVAQGGTGATSAATARTNLGLGTVSTLAVTGVQTAGSPIDLPSTSVPRVSETVYAARSTFGTYNTTTTVVNVDNELGGSAGLYSTNNTNGGSYPSNPIGYVWIETQQTYSGSSRVQHAYNYAASYTSGSGLYPRSWLRVSNQPGTAWGRWCEIYNQSNIVGTVSQTGGAPTGAVIERGSNTNGEYVRFADGTQICWLNITVTDQAIANAYGTLFQGVRTWNFPMPFIAAPTTTPGAFRWGSSASWAGLASAGTGSAVSLRGFDISSRAVGTSTDISAVAVGRWF